jgi:hypothetical protein
MKLLLSILLFALAGIASARDITFAWDLNPESDVTQYRVYTSPTNDGPWTLNGATALPATAPTTINELEVKGLPNLILFVYVTAVNQAGLESIPSDTLQVNPDRPGKPGKPRIKVVLQSSTDMKSWTDYMVMEKDSPDGPRQFFRATLAMAPPS